jgi:hypothetical protein
MRPNVLVGATLLLLAAAACGNGNATTGGPSSNTPATPVARPSSTAHLAILEPQNGQVISGTDVHVSLSLKGAKIVAATTTHITPNEGHVHIYLDNQIVAMNFGLTDDIPNVPAGDHILRAEFVASDHGPFEPRVFTAVTFQVKP